MFSCTSVAIHLSHSIQTNQVNILIANVRDDLSKKNLPSYVWVSKSYIWLSIYSKSSNCKIKQITKRLSTGTREHVSLLLNRFQAGYNVENVIFSCKSRLSLVDTILSSRERPLDGSVCQSWDCHINFYYYKSSKFCKKNLRF